MRLKPDAFPELPRVVAEDLERRGCTIPQTYLERGPHNVISGSFREPTQVDWAMLCSRAQASTILVYWAGSTDDVADLGTSPDEGWLQTIGGGKIGYSRFIATASVEAILHNRRVYGSSEHPPITHDGIEQGMTGKGSSVHYWHDGNWEQLPGGD